MASIKQFCVVLAALALAGSMFVGPIGVVAAQSSVSVDQTAQGTTTVAPGDTVTVDVSIDTTESGSPAIELEGVPSGWSIQATENDGGNFQSSNYEWFWLQDSDLNGSYSHTVTYEVTVPSDANDGSYSIDAVGSSQGSAGVDDDYEDTDTLSITVQSETQTTGSAEISVTPNSGVDASTWTDGAFQIDNTGEKEITSVTFDLSSTALPDVVFDPSGEAGDQGAKGFTPNSGASQVGLVGSSVSEPHNGQNNDEGYDKLTIDFDDFQGGESFAFSVDNDPTSIKGAGDAQSSNAGPISGLELAGATVTVEYADGTSQQTGLFGDGSDGGSQATAKANTPAEPTIAGVDGVSLDGSALDARHSAATVGQAGQSITVSGPPGETVTLLRMEASLNLVDAPGYELEPYEANKVVQVSEYSANLGPDGQATIDVTLTNSTDSVASDDAGYNYFLATVEDSEGDTGLTSNTVVLEYDPGANMEESGVSVEQTAQGSTTIAPGETVTVDVNIQTTNSGSPAIELDGVPAGWEIQALDNDSGDYNPATYEWFWLQDNNLDGDYSHTVTYEVTVPTDASDGTYGIDAVGSSQGNDGVDDDYEDSEPLSITVQAQQNQPPTATFTAEVPTPLTPGKSVTFNASGSNDSDGSIQSYAWDFGDGATTTGDGGETSHSYDSAGTYTVELTVTDDDGATDLTNMSITVGPPPVDGFENAPTDPDGDGKYEDDNGDGSVDVGDAQAIFANAQDPVVQNNIDAFDFNDDGSVNVGDAQALFANGVDV